MAEPTTIKIKWVTDKDPWNKPDSQQYYYDITVEGSNTEPWFFVQNRDKGDPAPEAGKEYIGNVYVKDAKKPKFYPAKSWTGNSAKPVSKPAPASKPTEEYWENKNATIRAQWAIGQAVAIYNSRSQDPEDPSETIETTAKILYAMVDRVAGEDDVQQAKQLAKSLDEGTSFSNGEPLPDEDYSKPIDMSDVPF